jgi:hypothetical protein
MQEASIETCHGDAVHVEGTGLPPLPCDLVDPMQPSVLHGACDFKGSSMYNLPGAEVDGADA